MSVAWGFHWSAPCVKRFAALGSLLLLSMVLSACANLTSNEISLHDSQKKVNPDAVKVKYQATVRIAGYVDGRNVGSSRKIGIAEARVSGLSGKELILDRDLTDVVSESLSKRLDEAGLQMLAKDDATALFELTGVIKEFRYDVKARDQVNIKLDTTLKEVATGNVIWAGEVVQKNERFAGVSGNSKSDIGDFLKQQLGIVLDKTSAAISSELMAKRPELFNLTPGTKAISGVTVFVAPNGIGSTELDTTKPKPNTSMLNPIHEAPGVLVVRTEPARAKVYLDGVYFGLSPLNIESAAGVRTVEVKMSGYRTASEKVAVRVGATTELEFQLEK